MWVSTHSNHIHVYGHHQPTWGDIKIAQLTQWGIEGDYPHEGGMLDKCIIKY